MILTEHAIDRFHMRIVPDATRAEAEALLTRHLRHAVPVRRRGNRSERWLINADGLQCVLFVTPSVRGERRRVIRTVISLAESDAEPDAPDGEGPPTSLFHAASRLADELSGSDAGPFAQLVESVEVSPDARVAAPGVLLRGFQVVAATHGPYKAFATRAAEALVKIGVDAGGDPGLEHWEGLRVLSSRMSSESSSFGAKASWGLIAGVAGAVVRDARRTSAATAMPLRGAFEKLSDELAASPEPSLRRASVAFARIAEAFSTRPVGDVPASHALLGFELLLADASSENKSHLEGICGGFRKVGVSADGASVDDAIACWDAVRAASDIMSRELGDRKAWRSTRSAWSSGLNTLVRLKRVSEETPRDRSLRDLRQALALVERLLRGQEDVAAEVWRARGEVGDPQADVYLARVALRKAIDSAAGEARL